MGLRRSKFTHVLLIVRIALENLLLFRESIEKVTASQGSLTYTMTAPKTKKVLTRKGKYVTVYKKQADGGWKAVAVIWNEDARPSLAKKHPSPAKKHRR